MYTLPFSARLRGSRAWWTAQSGNLRGAIWILLGTLLLSISIGFAKHLGKTFHVTQLLFLLQGTLLFMQAPWLIRHFSSVMKTNHLGLHLVRIGLILGAMISGLLALIHIPLAEATAINFGKSFFVTLFAILYLKEVVGLRRWLALIIGFAGIIIVAQPTGGSFNIWVIAAIIDAICAGGAIILIRYLARFDSMATLLVLQAIVIGVVMLGPALYFWRAPSTEEWGWLMLTSIIFALGQICHVRALSLGEATIIATLDYSRLIYSMIIGALIFHEWPTWSMLAGAGLIVSAAIYTMHREARISTPTRDNKE